MVAQGLMGGSRGLALLSNLASGKMVWYSVSKQGRGGRLSP